MVLASTLSTQGWWITSRAAGIAALVLASASVGVGLLIGGRFGRGHGPDLRGDPRSALARGARRPRRARGQRCSATPTSTRASPI